MRAWWSAFWLAVSITAAAAQGCGQSNPNCIGPTAPIGTNNNQFATTKFVLQNASGTGAGPYPQTVSGTTISGGIPYFSSATLLSSSALLAQYALVTGGGAGGAPVTLGSLGASNLVLHGNAGNVPAWSSVDLTNDVANTLPVGNGGTGVTSFTANLPVVGNGSSGLLSGTVSGNTTAFATVSGAFTSTHGVVIDANGNLVDAGGAPAIGGGGTVASSTIGQLPVYTGATTITGVNLAGDCTFISPNITCLKTNGTLFGALSTLNTINNSVWLGTQLTVGNGGTGVNIFGAGPLPVFASGATPFTTGTLSGNTTKLATVAAGSLTSGDAVKFDASGNITDAGAAPLLNGTTVTVAQGGTGAGTFTSNLPLIGNGTAAIAQGTVSGNTTKFVTTTGSLVNTHCVSIDASGNFVDAGGACTTGGGGGTVTSSLANQIAVYPSNGTTVQGIATAASGVLVTSAGSVPSISSSLPAGLTAGGTFGVSGIFSATGTTDSSSIGTGEIVDSGGLSVAKNLYVGGNVVLGNTSNLTANLTGYIYGNGGGSNATASTTIPATVLTGTLQAAQFPALTGDVTTAGGALATTVVNVNGVAYPASPTVGTVPTVTGANTVTYQVPNGKVLLATLTAVNSATLSDTTHITATYKHYDLVFNNLLPATNNASCEILAYVGGVYKIAGYIGVSNLFNTTIGTGTNATTYIPCGSYSGAGPYNAGSGLSGTITIQNPSSTSVAAQFFGTTYAQYSASASAMYMNYGQYNTTGAATTGFQVFFSAGNITSGSIEIYGWN